MKFYLSGENFTQALLVTNIMSDHECIVNASTAHYQCIIIASTVVVIFLEKTNRQQEEKLQKIIKQQQVLYALARTEISDPILSSYSLYPSQTCYFHLNLNNSVREGGEEGAGV